MLTLSLLRHAKSSWDDPNLGDFDRPLSPRGERAAPMIGRYMQRRRLVPEHVLASPALRAKATCELALSKLDSAVPVTFDETLYMASPRTLLALVRGAPARAHHLLVVGHNPGLHALATALIGSGPTKLRAELDDKLPTAGLVVIEFATDRFADVRPGTGKLVTFVTPKGLET